MADSRGAAKEAQAGHIQLERPKEIMATQPGVEEGYTPDHEIVEAVKRLPGYLQAVVTLMATMVPPCEDSKMQEKMGQEALAQATSMVLIVSILVHFNFYQVTEDRLFNGLFLFFFRAL